MWLGSSVAVTVVWAGSFELPIYCGYGHKKNPGLLKNTKLDKFVMGGGESDKTRQNLFIFMACIIFLYNW